MVCSPSLQTCTERGDFGSAGRRQCEPPPAASTQQCTGICKHPAELASRVHGAEQGCSGHCGCRLWGVCGLQCMLQGCALHHPPAPAHIQQQRHKISSCSGLTADRETRAFLRDREKPPTARLLRFPQTAARTWCGGWRHQPVWLRLAPCSQLAWPAGQESAMGCHGNSFLQSIARRNGATCLCSPLRPTFAWRLSSRRGTETNMSGCSAVQQ